MKKTLVVFSVNNQAVHQIDYNGLVDIRIIKSNKILVAGENRVTEDEVKVSFKEDTMTQIPDKKNIVSSQIKLVIADRLRRTEKFS